MDTNTGLATAGTMQGTTYIWASSTSINGVAVRSDTNTPPAELCVECRQYKKYQQNSSTDGWANTPYAYHKSPWLEPSSSTTIAMVGCIMTDQAMILSTINNDPFLTPGTFDERLCSLELYTKDGNNYTTPENLLLFSSKIISANHISYDYNVWATELDNCNSIMAHVNSNHPEGHYILLIKRMNNVFSPMKPLFLAYDPLMLTYRYVYDSELKRDSASVLVKYSIY